MNENFEIATDEVEFDEELYNQNLEENDFSAWDNAEGIGSDDVKGDVE